MVDDPFTRTCEIRHFMTTGMSFIHNRSAAECNASATLYFIGLS